TRLSPQLAPGEQDMSNFNSQKRLLAVCALTGLAWAGAASMPAAEQGASAPDFSSNDAAWVLADRDGDYIPVPGGPSPTRNDPAHPHVGNGTRAQPTFRVADLANPNIKPWATEIMRRENHKVLEGGIGYAA